MDIQKKKPRGEFEVGAHIRHHILTECERFLLFSQDRSLVFA